MSLYTALLFLHIFGAIAGLGPSFVFGRIQSLAAGENEAVFASRVAHSLTTKVVIPLAILVMVTGVGLAFETGYGLVGSTWLSVSFLLFAFNLLFAGLVQAPALKRTVAINEHLDAQIAGEELRKLKVRIRLGGIYLRLSAVFILILMIFKPF